MEQKLDDLMNILQQMESRLIDMELKIDLLRNTSNNVEKNCDKMRNHIDFDENTYNIVRTQLNYISNKIKRLTSNRDDSELPKIEDTWKIHRI